MGNYEALFPLPWNRKWGFYYIYPPYFTQQLGIFSPSPVTGELVGEFLDRLPVRFRLMEMNLNSGNLFDPARHPHWKTRRRVNLQLDLVTGYEALRRGYKTWISRNISRAEEAGLSGKEEPSTAEIIALSRIKMKTISSISSRHYSLFSQLADHALSEHKAVRYGVYSPQGLLLAGAIFFLSHHRAYYLLAGNAAAGRKLGASHLLIDTFIRDHAGHPLVLDFEGSDHPGLSYFYRGFGAREETYPFIRQNRLPWPARWLKE